MKQIIKLISVISLGVSAAFNFVLAQGENIPPEIMEQYQQQLNNQGNNSSYQQTPPATNLPTPEVKPKEEPEGAPAPFQEKVLPIEEKKVTPSGEALPQTEIQAQYPASSPENSIVPQTVQSAATEKSNQSSFVFYSVSAAAIIFAFLGSKWWRKLLKQKKKSGLPSEAENGKETVPCPTCGGSGKITKKRMKSVDCGHCKGTGKDICHHCGGSGRCGLGFVVPKTEEEVENFMKCDYCKGTGFPKPPIACCMCKGKRKIEYQESYEETCPTCKGAGSVAK